MPPTRTFPRMRSRPVLWIAAILLLGAVLQFVSVNPAVSQAPYLRAYQAAADPGLDPDSPAWKDVPSIQVALSAQRASYAIGGGSVTTLRAQALHYNNRLFVRVEWADPTRDDSTTRVQDFADAAALEFPAKSAASVPSICMGQADAGVNIWHWRADSEAGLRDPEEVYPAALVDAQEDPLPVFYTARDAGNPFANPDLGSVQTLISRTFGALTTARFQDVAGQGRYSGSGWAVVFSREYEGYDAEQTAFKPGTSTDMAFAIWNGSEGDRNGRKAISQFVTLQVGANMAPGDTGANLTVVALAALIAGGLTLVGLGLGAYGIREARRGR